LQIAAVFVLLIAASLGAGLPNILRRKPEPSDAPTSVLGQLFFLLKHFGTGIILSTAFVHLLFHAFIFMSNECIGTLVYEAASPAIAMGAVWLVFVVDFFVLRALRQRAAAAAAASRPLSQGSHDPESKLQSDSESASSDVASQDVPTAAQAKLRKYDVLMLEAGIIFHSIIIGVTLGASNGEGWVPLFIAITFHQLFEGLALGARIALLPSTTAGWLQKTIMCGAYAVTTPVGIAIGIGARRSFNTNDRSTLLALGILDSISAGILLYTALVELIAGDFINNKTMSGAPLGRAIAAVTALTLGAAAM
ncbi:Zinc/iron permease, partial [Tilletiopsis washingtonensis]